MVKIVALFEDGSFCKHQQSEQRMLYKQPPYVLPLYRDSTSTMEQHTFEMENHLAFQQHKYSVQKVKIQKYNGAAHLPTNVKNKEMQKVHI